ncbi:MAG: DUF4179 domain-containing protein [bacterium]
MNKDYDDIKIPENLDDYINNGIEQAQHDIKNKNIIITNTKELDNMKFNKNNLSKVALIAVVLGSTLALTNQNTFANIKSFIENPSSLASLLNGTSDLVDYTTILNTTISSKGVDVTLKEVILDPATNELHVLSYVKSDFINYNKENDIAYHQFHMTFTEIYINGKNVNTAGSGTQRHVDDNVIELLQSFDLDKSVDLSGDIDLKIKFSEAMYTDYSDIAEYLTIENMEDDEYIQHKDLIEDGLENAKTEKIKGNWVFEFTTNGDDLYAKTNSTPINQRVAFYDEKSNSEYAITLNEYIANDVSQKIIFSIDDYEKLSDYGIFLNLELAGKDSLGNDISFYNTGVSNGIGVFEINKYGFGIEDGVEYATSIDTHAESLNLNLFYRVLDLGIGKITGDYLKAEDEVVIYLDNNTSDDIVDNNSTSTIQDYTTLIDSTVSDNGVDIMLKEVILDPLNKELHVLNYVQSDFVNYDKELDLSYNEFFLSSINLFINGEPAYNSASGTERHIDNNTIEILQSFKLSENIDLSGDLDIKVSYDYANYIDYSDVAEYMKLMKDEDYSRDVNGVKNMSDEDYDKYVKILSNAVSKSKTETIKGDWSFEFTTNGDDLAINSFDTSLAKFIPLADPKTGHSYSITLDNYTQSHITQKVFYTFDDFQYLGNDNRFVQFELRGVDNLNNPIVFYDGGMRSTGVDNKSFGDFSLDKFEQSVTSNNADFLTLDLYYRFLDSYMIDSDEDRDAVEYIKAPEQLVVYLNK